MFECTITMFEDIPYQWSWWRR